jgi:hypothetical protein
MVVNFIGYEPSAELSVTQIRMIGKDEPDKNLNHQGVPEKV